VVVVHENRGLNPYIEDVARRLAKQGYVAFAPDGLTSVGGYPGTDEAGVELQKKVDPAKLMEDFCAAFETVSARSDVNGKIGIIGFCYGGGVVNSVAVRYPTLAAAVPYYGRQPSAGDSAKIKSPLVAHYAEMDTAITSGWPDFDKALTAAKVEHAGYIYPGAQHGFHNDTTPRYDEKAAKLSWERTTEFFKKKLA
jgi:carboxymethylenebutenolidase